MSHTAALPTPRERHDTRGLVLVLLATLGYAGMALWAKEAYADGFTPQGLVAVRFVLVAAIFWAIAIRRGSLRTRPPRRAILAGLVLGLTFYAAENGLYFAAVERIDAGLASLVMSIYPALVVGGAIVLGRERGDVRRIGALGLGLAGAALVLAGGAGGAFDGVGALLALGAAMAYATYLLAGDRLVAALDPFLLSAVAATGAAVTLTATAAGTGQLTVPGHAGAWVDLAGLVLVSSAVPMGALWCGVQRLGAANASIVASVEPAITVTLAALLLGEHLRDVQLLGGALVVGAVVLLNARRAGASERSGSVRGDEPAADAAAPAPARALAHGPA